MFRLSQPRFSRVRYRKGPLGFWRYQTNLVEDEKYCQNEVRIERLKADRLYRYEVQVRASSGDKWKRIARGSFRTAPAGRRPFRFVAYGDSRGNDKVRKQVAKSIREEKPEFVVHSGDLVSSGTNLNEWVPEFFEPASEYTGAAALWPALGNHEQGSAWYFTMMALPNNERWYSFDWADAHFVVLDSNVAMTPGSRQYRWLEEDLAKTEKRWRFVTFHHPAFSSGHHGKLGEDGLPKEKPMRDAAKYILPLGKKYNVALFFWGHDHIYERSVKDGLGCITTGGGGAPVYTISEGRNPYSVVAKDVFHYCVVDVNGDRLKLTAKTPEGDIVDEFELQLLLESGRVELVRGR